MVKKQKTKTERIAAEEKRLRRIYKDLPSQKKLVADGLIQRAAALRVTLEDLEADLIANGYVEMFQQGQTQKPYERQRPAAQLYTSFNTTYQKITKQLTDLLPKENGEKADTDELIEFLKG